MPKITGPTKEKITFGCDPTNFKKINKIMEEKEFSTVTDLINTALVFYFENRNRTSQKDDFKAWVVSEEGENYLKDVFRKIKDE